jgi:predicted dienelactone hydrolase
MSHGAIRIACLAATLICVSSGVTPRLAARVPFELPPPSGARPVATTSWHLVDDSRRETLAAESAQREVHVLAWYPAAAAPAGAAAPYLREGVAEVRTFARLLRDESAFDELAGVRTHSTLDGPPATGAPFPVLLFSHGYTGIPSAHTALFEDLASHGYAVLSIVHPYEATAAALTGGRTVTMLDEEGRPLPALREVFGEWATEDAAMASVTRASAEPEQLRLLRAYLDTLSRTNIALRRWVDDTTLVVDRLRTPLTGAPGRLAARLDVGRLGALGHSMGGVTAGQFCVEDARCRGALNLDGIPQYGTMIDKGMSKPFLMMYSARPGRAGASDAIYRKASTYYRVDVKDSLHLEFTDMVFWGGPLRQRPLLGAIPPLRVTEITRTVVRAFFDEVLEGQRSAMLNGPSPFPEMSVTRTP